MKSDEKPAISTYTSTMDEMKTKEAEAHSSSEAVHSDSLSKETQTFLPSKVSKDKSRKKRDVKEAHAVKTDDSDDSKVQTVSVDTSSISKGPEPVSVQSDSKSDVPAETEKKALFTSAFKLASSHSKADSAPFLDKQSAVHVSEEPFSQELTKASSPIASKKSRKKSKLKEGKSMDDIERGLASEAPISELESTAGPRKKSSSLLDSDVRSKVERKFSELKSADLPASEISNPAEDKETLTPSHSTGTSVSDAVDQSHSAVNPSLESDSMLEKRTSSLLKSSEKKSRKKSNGKDRKSTEGRDESAAPEALLESKGSTNSQKEMPSQDAALDQKIEKSGESVTESISSEILQAENAPVDVSAYKSSSNLTRLPRVPVRKRLEKSRNFRKP
jgi:hypothetical protein